jgi:hypothetical protein
MSNIELNKQIGECETVDEVLELVSHRGHDMNVVNCVTGLQRLAKLSISGNGFGVGSRSVDEARLWPLLTHAAACFVAPRPGKWNTPQPRHIAGALWACAKLELTEAAVAGLLSAAVRAGEATKPSWFKPQELSMTAWALGKLSNTSSPLITSSLQRFVASLLPSAIARSADFDAQGLANLIQGVAATGLPPNVFCPGGGGGPALAGRLAGCLSGRLASLNFQETANALSGLAKLEVSNQHNTHFMKNVN